MSVYTAVAGCFNTQSWRSVRLHCVLISVAELNNQYVAHPSLQLTRVRLDRDSEGRRAGSPLITVSVIQWDVALLVGGELERVPTCLVPFFFLSFLFFLRRTPPTKKPIPRL